MKDQSLSFRKLYDDESRIILERFRHKETEFVVWEKGSQKRFTVTCSDASAEKGFFQFIKLPEQLAGKVLLLAFKSNKIQYFSNIGNVDVDNNILYVESIFKSERRESYRLMCFPIFKFFVSMNDTSTYDGSNLFDFRYKMSQTKLFKSFLKLMNDNDDEEDTSQNQKYRIEDLSAGGIAFICSELESSLFYKNLKISNIVLELGDEHIQIPESVVCYNLSKVDSMSKNNSFKIGLEFQNVDINLDHKISEMINTLMRKKDFTKTFEVFLDD